MKPRGCNWNLLQWLTMAALAGVCLLAACPQDRRDSNAGLGAKVYAEHHCGMCHGDNREGKSLAPPLTGLGAHWTAEKLVQNYFPDPVAYQNSDPRLSAMLQTYSTMKMPPVQGRPEDLKALAQWLTQP